MWRVLETGEVLTWFWWGGIGDLEDPGVAGRIILKQIFKRWDGSMDGIDLARNRDRWRAVANAVINIRVP
jgi:hypothetical protein